MASAAEGGGAPHKSGPALRRPGERREPSPLRCGPKTTSDGDFHVLQNACNDIFDRLRSTQEVPELARNCHVALDARASWTHICYDGQRGWKPFAPGPRGAPAVTE